MSINLDNNDLTQEEKKLIVHNILLPLINKLQSGNKKLLKIFDRLELSSIQKKLLFEKFKLNIKNLKIQINSEDKNNLIKII
jgi:hypothetical protein